MDCCIVCLQTNCHPFSRITIHSSEWNIEQIQRVVEKHFWWWYLKPQAESHNIRWICKYCWQEISSFHKFYLKVEMVHKQYETFLPTNISKEKSKEFIADDIEGQFVDKCNTSQASINYSERDKPCSLSDLAFNKKVYQEQKKESESRHQEEENVIILNDCIKNEKIIEEFQTNKNNSRAYQMSEDPYKYSFNVDNMKNSRTNIKENNNDNHHTDNVKDKFTNEKQERESNKRLEAHANFARPKKNDVIDFYNEFEFKLECIVCNSSELTFARLCSHYKDHHDMRGFAMCCGVKFFKRHLLIDHLCVHKDPSFFKCHKCHRVYRARDNLNFHLRKKKCTPKFLGRKNLMRHKLTHLRPKSQKYTCKICNRNFDSEDLLKSHAETRNCKLGRNGGETMFCHKIESESRHQEEQNETILNASIKSEKDFEEYHTSESSAHVCQVSEASHEYNLNADNMEDSNHHSHNIKDKLTHEKEDRESSKSPEVHANFARPKKNDVIDFNNEFQFKLECIICNSSELTFVKLCSHYKEKHAMRGFAMCCGVKFFRRHLLIDHLCVHKDPNFFKCHKCHRVYRARDNLNFHLRKNKCTPKFECNQCDKQFLGRKNLMRHKLTHLRPKCHKLICEICNKNFDSEALLKGHVQTRNCKLECQEKNNCPATKTTNSNYKKSNDSNSNIAATEKILGGTEDITTVIKNEPSYVAEIHHEGTIVLNETNMVETPGYDKNDFDPNSENDSSSENSEENNKSKPKAFKNMYGSTVSDDFFREMQYIMECRVCNKILPDFQSLTSHYRTEHNKLGYGMCCGNKYYRRGTLADHLKLHKDPNLFKCQLCNRKLGTRRGLEKHIEVCIKRFEEN